MRNTRPLTLAALATTAAATWLSPFLSAAPPAADPNVAPPAPAAQTASDKTPDKPDTDPSAADERALRSELATLVEDATTPGRFDQLLHQFARAQRPSDTSAKQAPKADPHDPFERAIARFQDDWKDRYAQDFNLRGNEAKIFTDIFARIDVGDFGDAARTAAARIPPTPVTSPAKPNAPTAAKADTKAINRAVVTLPESHGSPSVTLRFVQEGAAWKLDADTPVDPTKLRDALTRQLRSASSDKSHWPKDQNDAYRATAHHVFQAITEATTGVSASATTPDAPHATQ